MPNTTAIVPYKNTARNSYNSGSQSSGSANPYDLSHIWEELLQRPRYTTYTDYTFTRPTFTNSMSTTPKFTNTKLNTPKTPLGKFWNSSSGIQPYKLGKAATALGALYNLYGVGKGLKNFSKAKDQTEDIMSDIVTASYNNPMLQYDLDAEQLKLLRQLRNNRYDNDPDIDWSDTVGGAIKGGLYGLTGGIPGVIVGALGGGANAAVNSLSDAQTASNDELEALYDAILQSEQEYNALRKQRMLEMGLY